MSRRFPVSGWASRFRSECAPCVRVNTYHVGGQIWGSDSRAVCIRGMNTSSQPRLAEAATLQLVMRQKLYRHACKASVMVFPAPHWRGNHFAVDGADRERAIAILKID